MILGAGLLLLLGLGLLVAGVLTGLTALYWACVAACLVAAVVLVLVRRRMAAEARAQRPAAPPQAREPEVHRAERRPSATRAPAGEPPLEEVEVTDLLLVMDLRDEVLVVDEHPRYHLSGCPHLAGAETFPLPIDEARSDGFTPCGSCAPDRHLAQLTRQRTTGH